MRLTKCADKGIASNFFVFIQGQLDSVVHQLSKPLFFEPTGPVSHISYEASLGPGKVCTFGIGHANKVSK